MAGIIGALDLKETRIPILIPFAATSAFAVFQLYLGCDPLIMLMSMTAILITFLPFHFNGRDLYSLCAMVVGLRYVGVALIIKTLYLQPLQTHLYDPTATYAWMVVLMSVYTGVFMLARHFDRGGEIISFPTDARGLRRLSVASFCIGAAALLFIGSKTSTGTHESAGGALIIAANLQALLILAIIAEASRSLEVSRGRNLFSPFLILMLVFSFFVISALNMRGAFLSCAIGLVLVGFIYKALKLRYIAIGLVFIAFFLNFVTPVILYCRFQKQLPALQFIEYSRDTAFKAATDPAFLAYVKTVVNAQSGTAGGGEYDYFGDHSGVGNRLSFVALFDTVYNANKGLVPVGINSVWQSIDGAAPGFLGFIKRPESLGDWLGWQTGLVAEGGEPFINFGLPMEGYTSWGWIGAIIYPFLFIFPFIWAFTRISSFRLPLPTSIFIFTEIQAGLIEQTSDSYINGITRGVPIMFGALFALHWLFFRNAVRADAIAAPAES
ncbi:MAG: hypothetical protein ACLPSF_10350 [Methylocella sp.]